MPRQQLLLILLARHLYHRRHHHHRRRRRHLHRCLPRHLPPCSPRHYHHRRSRRRSHLSCLPFAGPTIQVQKHTVTHAHKYTSDACSNVCSATDGWQYHRKRATFIFKITSLCMCDVGYVVPGELTLGRDTGPGVDAEGGAPAGGCAANLPIFTCMESGVLVC